MTNEQAEIQQAAREHHDRWRERGQVSTPQDRLAEKVDFHISQSEEERKRIQELERALGEAISWIYYAPESVILELRGALSSSPASAEREVKG